MNHSLVTVEVTRSPAGHTVVVLRGELDMSNASDVDRRVRAQLPPAGGRTVVDLADVSYLDSSGLRILADLAQEPTIELVVVAPAGGASRQALAASRLDQHLDVRDQPPAP